MQQNQALPKTNVGEAYYARQMWLYNFGVVIHTAKDMIREKLKGKKLKCRRKKNVFMYTWLESQAAKGSNEIVSALSHFFFNVIQPLIARRRYKKIDMFSDVCPGQNKNTTMLCFLLQKVQEPRIYQYVRSIDYYFPVKGHSYLPPDRVFGRIEKDLRKLPTITSPAQYQEVFEKQGTVFVYNDDWIAYNMKQLAASTLKPITRLCMKKNRVWSFSRRKPGQVAVLLCSFLVS